MWCSAIVDQRTESRIQYSAALWVSEPPSQCVCLRFELIIRSSQLCEFDRRRHLRGGCLGKGLAKPDCGKIKIPIEGRKVIARLNNVPVALARDIRGCLRIGASKRCDVFELKPSSPQPQAYQR